MCENARMIDWSDKRINLVCKFTDNTVPYTLDSFNEQLPQGSKFIKFEFEDAIVKLYRLTVQILNVKSLEHGINIFKSINIVNVNSIPSTSQWKIVNTHKDIIIPKGLLNNIENYIKCNSKYRPKATIVSPKTGTSLSEYTLHIYCFKSGTFGIIFNIFTGSGKMSCSSGNCEDKLEEFISLFT